MTTLPVPPLSVRDPGAFNDVIFFSEHTDRQFRIRPPASDDEADEEFQTLGSHEKSRRRIIAARIKVMPRINPMQMQSLSKLELTALETRIMRIPFLAFSDETIADTDEILFPIYREIMENAG